MSAPTISVSLQTHSSPRLASSSTINSRVGWGMAFVILARASYFFCALVSTVLPLFGP